jgi:hypothetical protein
VALELRPLELGERRGAQQAGVAQDGLDVPRPRARLEQGGQVLVGGDVAALLGGGPARRLDERDGLGRRLLRDVPDDDVGPVGREGQRGGPPMPEAPPVMSTTRGSPLAHPRVEELVGDVGQRVDEDVEEGHGQRRALDDG